MFRSTPALVLREVRYNEADRLLTVYTKTDGLITARARGALRRGSKIAAATQQLTYSDMTLFGNKGKWIINEASIIEPFAGLREDLSAFSLGTYFSQCVETLGVEDEPDEEMLSLILNSLYALSKELYPREHVKAAFEFRLMCISGYTPELSVCAVCGKEPDDPCLSLSNGTVFCRKCRNASIGRAISLCPESLAALRYICSAPPKKIMNYEISDKAIKTLSDATEAFLIERTERTYPQLDYYKKINRLL